VHYNSYEPQVFERALADTVNEVALDPDTASAMGTAGRARAVAEFSWTAIAHQTMEVYRAALAARGHTAR